MSLPEDLDISFDNVPFWNKVKEIMDIVDDAMVQNEEEKKDKPRKQLKSSQNLSNFNNIEVDIETNMNYEDASEKQQTNEQNSLLIENDSKNKERNESETENKVNPELQKKIYDLKEYKQKSKVSGNPNLGVKSEKHKSYKDRINRGNYKYPEFKREFDDHTKPNQKFNKYQSSSKFKPDNENSSDHRINKKYNPDFKKEFDSSGQKSSIKSLSSKNLEVDTETNQTNLKSNPKLNNVTENKTVSNVKINYQVESQDDHKNQKEYSKDIKTNVQTSFNVQRRQKTNSNTEFANYKDLDSEKPKRYNQRSMFKRDSSYEDRLPNENKGKWKNNKFNTGFQSKFNNYRDNLNNRESHDNRYQNNQNGQTRHKTSYKQEFKNERKYDQPFKTRRDDSSDYEYQNEKSFTRNKNKQDSNREFGDKYKPYKKQSNYNSEDDYTNHEANRQRINKKYSNEFNRGVRNERYKKQIERKSYSSSEDDFSGHEANNERITKKDSNAFHREFVDKNKRYKKNIERISDSEDEVTDHRAYNHRTNKQNSYAFNRESRDKNKQYKKQMIDRNISSSEYGFSDRKTNNRRIEKSSDSKSFREFEKQRGFENKTKLMSPDRGNEKEYQSRRRRDSSSASESENETTYNNRMKTRSGRSENETESDSGMSLVRRREWGAPKSKWGRGPGLKTPVPYVFVLSTNKRSCYNKEDCAKEMLFLIERHMKTQLCPDIKYNFVIGGDGRVYEGRGWTTRPGLPVAHKNLNKFSILIALAGTYSEKFFPRIMREARNDVIAYGVKHKYIAENYELNQLLEEKVKPTLS